VYPGLLTLQTDTVETGSVRPIDMVHGDAISGSNKSTDVVAAAPAVDVAGGGKPTPAECTLSSHWFRPLSRN